MLKNLHRRFSLLAICISIGLISSSCFLFGKNETPKTVDTPNEPIFDLPKSNLDLAKPIEYSQSPKDIKLCKKINQTIENSEFKNARWGMIAISLKDGRAVCGIDAQKLFNPASIQKLLTSIVALDKLGKDFRWKTSVYSEGDIENGTLNGDIILYGRGAPDLNDESLTKIISQLKGKGVKRIDGKVIGDQSYFKGDTLGDGWTWNEAQWYYGARASALTINENRVIISLQNGKPKSDSKLVELSGEVQPVEDIEAIGLKRELGTNKIYIWGNGENLRARVAVSKPALLAAKIFREKLEESGIEITGETKRRDWKSPDQLNTKNADEIAYIESEPLSKIIRKMNKDSVNIYAELILRTLGKKFGIEAPDDNPKMQKLRGDDSAGASVIKKWLAEKNIATNEIAIHDGSGLSRLDFVTPEVFARALIYASSAEFSEAFKNSLPVSGQSGTLKGRLKNISGKILAKTGTITYASSLAGYAKSSGETYAFVVICNNETRKAESSKVIDEVISILAYY